MASVELAQARERDVTDVHIEAHADCVSGNHIIHLASLVHRDLSVSRPGGERTEDHGCATPLTAHPFGQLVYPIDGAADDGAAPW